MSDISRRVFLKDGFAGALALCLAGNSVSGASSRRKQRASGVPKAGDFDVVVVGGGPSGVMAALAASRLGAKTALVERYGFLGGMATTGYVTPLSGFFFKGERVIGGLPWDFIKRLEGMGGAFVEVPKGNIDFDIELYKLCMQRMALEYGVSLFMHSSLAGCVMEADRISEILVQNKNGMESISGKMFIDATGDGDLAHLAKVPMQNDDVVEERQPSSFCFVLSGVDTGSEMLKRYMYHNGVHGSSQCAPVRKKLLELKDKGKNIPDFGGPWFNSVMHEGSVAVNITRAGVDSCDNRAFTEAECRLREDIFTFATLLKENFPEFKDSWVSSTAPQAGIRESRRILGVHTVTVEEYVSGIKYPDGISRGAHPIDMHAAKGTGQRLTSLKVSPYVPFRALIASGFPNLAVAGRCLSCDRAVLASVRVQASCMGLGQAAGAAAAMSLSSGDIRKAGTEALVSTLKGWGACL